MFESIKNFFFTDKEPKNTGSYRARSGNGVYDGEKQSGNLSYPSAHKLNRRAMVLRSMKCYEESMQARAAVNRLNDSVINTGLALESTPKMSILGINNEIRKKISNQIETSYSLWATSKNCDISQNNTLGQIERILFNSQIVKGEYFAFLQFSDDPKLLNQLQIRIIPTERIDTPAGTNDKKLAESRGNRIVEGLEIDENNSTVAFYIKSKKPGTFKTTYTRIEKFSKNGRVQMVHGNRQRFGNEVRGIPILANVAHELEKVTDYSLLELMSAIANATIAATVEPGENAPASNPMPLASMVPPSIQQSNGMWQDNTDAAADLDSGYTNIGKSVLKNSGGLLISSLNAGEKLQSYDTKRPNVNFSAFVDSITKYLSAALGIPIEVLYMTFGSNFSASRASLKLFWQSLQVWRDEFVSDFLTPVYDSFLLAEVGTGRIVLRGFDENRIRAAWSSAKWIGIESPSIDPVKEAKAASERNKQGHSTREQEAQKYNGSSFDSNVERLKNENQNLSEANEPLTVQKVV